MKMAVQHNVSFIMYGENEEVEYGVCMKNAFSPTREIADHDGHYFSGKPPEFWIDHSLMDSDIAPFTARSMNEIRSNRTGVHFWIL